MQRSEWQRLCACCQRHGAYLFSDEMYRGLEHDMGAKLPAAADSYEKGISLCGVSKALSMPGLRIGWVAMQDTALLQRIMQLRDYTTICCSAPSEVCLCKEHLLSVPEPCMLTTVWISQWAMRLCHEAVAASSAHRLSHLYLFKCTGVGSDGITATGSNLAEKHGLH